MDKQSYINSVIEDLASDANLKVEGMSDFFSARIEGYEDHMKAFLSDAYTRLAELVPRSARTLLDLGCGTGLELEAVFETLPDVHITGIDTTQVMLERLSQKFGDTNLELIHGDFLKTELGAEKYDAAISFQVMHHFSPVHKAELYARIFDSIRRGGCYIECDFIAEYEEEVELYSAEKKRKCLQSGVSESELLHLDIPLTIPRQTVLLRDTGFAEVRVVHRQEATAIFYAKKRH